MKDMEFVEALESVFGEYRAGMRAVVVDWASRQRPQLLDNILAELVELHDGYWPPPLAAILKVAREVRERPPKLVGLPEPKPTEAECEIGALILRRWLQKAGA